MSQDAFSILVLFVMVVLAVGLIIALAKWTVGARKTDASGYEIVGESGGMRRAIIRIAEAVAILLVIALTISGAFSSAIFSYFFSGVVTTLSREGLLPDPSVLVAVSAIVGAVTGFFSGALLTAPVFALSAIEKNTRRTAAFLERLAQPRQ